MSERISAERRQVWLALRGGEKHKTGVREDADADQGTWRPEGLVGAEGNSLRCTAHLAGQGFLPAPRGLAGASDHDP